MATFRKCLVTNEHMNICPKTSEELRDWQHAMGFTYDSAAAALGISRATYARYIAGAEIPISIGLACQMLGLQQESEKRL